MIYKQRSWKRSNKVLVFSFLLPISNYSFSMDYSDYQMWQRLSQNPSTLQTSEVTPASAEFSNNSYETNIGGPRVEQRKEKNLWASPIPDDKKTTYSFEGTTWQEMEEIFPDAPLRAQVLVDHLKKNINPKVRASCFIGPQGSGKSITAKAIAHFANWHIHFIAAGDLIANYGNKTKERLLKELKFIVSCSREKKVVVILDDANELFEHADNENHDSLATAAFCQFLDSQKLNMNLFIICTMNRITQLPRHLKQRLEQSLVFFNAQSNYTALKNTFKKQVALNPKVKLDSSVNDACIDRCIDELKKREAPITGRDFENVLSNAFFLCYTENPESNDKKIKPKHLEKSAKLIANLDNPNFVEEAKL